MEDAEPSLNPFVVSVLNARTRVQLFRDLAREEHRRMVQLLIEVQHTPDAGVTVPEIAKVLGVNKSHLYAEITKYHAEQE